MWMSDTLAVVVIITGIVWGFAWMGAKLSENRVRKKAVEAGLRPEDVRSLFEEGDQSPSGYGALKWGLVAVALGLGLLAEALLPYDLADPVAYGVLLVLGGLALIAYYAYVDRSSNGERE